MSETTAVDDLLAAEVGNPEFVAQQPAMHSRGSVEYRQCVHRPAATWPADVPRSGSLREIVAFTPPGTLIDRKNAVLT